MGSSSSRCIVFDAVGVSYNTPAANGLRGIGQIQKGDDGWRDESSPGVPANAPWIAVFAAGESWARRYPRLSGPQPGGRAGTQASINVAVVPGFTPPNYPGLRRREGRFPAANPRLSAYHFSQLPTSQLTAGNLASYDTVILYGIRWSTISASGQAALNAFAATHKVMIWDADGTGAQNYGTFIQPFSTLASNASGQAPGFRRDVPNIRGRLRRLPREL